MRLRDPDQFWMWLLSHRDRLKEALGFPGGADDLRRLPYLINGEGRNPARACLMMLEAVRRHVAMRRLITIRNFGWERWQMWEAWERYPVHAGEGI